MNDVLRKGAAVSLTLLVCGVACAAPDPIICEWFEQQYDEMERKMPDFFLAGYGAVWLPPNARCTNSDSAGYNVFNRFDLGSPGNPTAYGTEEGFHAVIDEFHRANSLVYLDIIMNHDSGRQTSASFQAAGGYPGFWMDPADPPVDKTPTSAWGDFHAGNAQGYMQSEDPNGSNYNLYDGDLVGLVDIDQASNNVFIRQPTTPGDPQNIPAGTSYNKPDAGNARFYPDLSLSPTTFWNPGTSRNPGAQQITLYPFNTATPMAGDPVAENATGLLVRWTQWMCDEFGVDGFRLDAAKHIPSWFWDNVWDNYVYLRRTTPDGRHVTPLSFVEAVAGNTFVYDNYVRKDGFGNRDALDLGGAGKLRDLISAGGFGTWATPLFDAEGGHIDNKDDGFNNGSLGVLHVFSHDNGSTGDGASAPGYPSDFQQGYPENAYIILRPGRTVVYHNARGITRSGGFWPRAGNTTALGWDPLAQVEDDTITNLVHLQNEYGRGYFIPVNDTDPVNQSYDDVLIFTRRSPNSGVDNLLVGVSDRNDSGYEERSIQTAFAPGTRLHELTGNADDPVIDPSDNIPNLLTVDGSQRVTIRVPHNTTGSTVHGKGFVVYGEALPDVTLTLTNVAGTIAGDAPTTPAYVRRNADIPVIQSDTFTIQLQTAPGDALDPNTDTSAAFLIDEGYVDYNFNLGVDYSYNHEVIPGYEGFLTVNSPLYTGGTGQYEQLINATQLDEGMHYLTTAVFRHRGALDNPLFTENRAVFYVDRLCPQFELEGGDQTVTSDIFAATINALDRTSDDVHVLLNLPAGSDPLTSTNIFTRATQRDRFLWERSVGTLQPGANRLTVVVFEESGRACYTDYTITYDLGQCSEADITTQGAGSGDPGYGVPDGQVTAADLNYFVNAWVAGTLSIADVTTQGAGVGDPGYGVPDGQVTAADLNYYVNLWVIGCP